MTINTTNRNKNAVEIRAEIEEIKGTIDNERVWALVDSIHERNIAQLEAYIETLEEMLEESES